MISAHESLIGTYKAIKSSQGPVAFQMFLNNHSPLLKAQSNLHPWLFRYSILSHYRCSEGTRGVGGVLQSVHASCKLLRYIWMGKYFSTLLQMCVCNTNIYWEKKLTCFDFQPIIQWLECQSRTAQVWPNVPHRIMEGWGRNSDFLSHSFLKITYF